MSINAVTRVSPDAQQIAQPQAAKPAPAVTPFSQQLDAQLEGAHGHHHHGGAAQPEATSASGAPSPGGSSSAGSVVAPLLKMLG